MSHIPSAYIVIIFFLMQIKAGKSTQVVKAGLYYDEKLKDFKMLRTYPIMRFLLYAKLSTK